MKVEITSDTGGKLTLNKQAIRGALRKAGQDVRKLAQQMIRSGGASGRKYQSHTASAPGQAPANWRGDLAKSISVRMNRDGTKVSIRDSAYYSLALEAGASGGGGTQRGKTKSGQQRGKRRMEPRPFLTAALEQLSPEIQKSIGDALKDAPVQEQK